MRELRAWRFLAPAVLFLAACSTVGQNSTMHAASSSAVMSELPSVTGPIDVTETSWPLLNQRELMAQHDYVEEEFFLSGRANVYEWAGNTRQVRAIFGPTEYTNRILVRRPRDPARFSGNVELNILNATRSIDFGGPLDIDRMFRQGDAWIGVTSKAVNVNALQRFDPERYAPLNWASPVPEEARCARPAMMSEFMTGGAQLAALAPLTSAPETEDGLFWDMLGQLGLLLKSEQRNAILPGFDRPYVYVTGISQSSIYIRTFFTGFHEHYRTPEGAPVFDGYLAIVAPDMARVHQCAPEIPITDPRHFIAPRPDVPFISLSAEGEMWLGRYTHQPDDVTAGGGIITYEVAGSSHSAAETPGLPRSTLASPSGADLTRAGFAPPSASMLQPQLPPGAVNNDFPWQPIIRGAYHNLQRWVREGVIPPQAPGIQVNDSGALVRDADGNALGGVRMPYIDVPTAAHRGFLTAGGLGGISGAKTPFTPERLRELYPTQQAYVSQFTAATNAMVRDRWISQEDADAMIRAAQDTPVP